MTKKLSCEFKEFTSVDEWDKDSFIIAVGFFLNNKKQANTLVPLFMQYNKEHDDWNVVISYKWKDSDTLDGFLMWASFPSLSDIEEFIKERNYFKKEEND